MANINADNNRELAKNLAVADLQGLYSKHSEMWKMFHNALKVYGVIISIPILVIGAIAPTGYIDLTKIKNVADLPKSLNLLLFTSGILAFFATQTLIRYRLDIIMYARAINSFRKLYVSALSNEEWKPKMPTNDEVPISYEPFRAMGYLVVATGIINSLYISLGAYALFGKANLVFILITAFILIIIQLIIYRAQCKTKSVLGSDI